MFCAGIIESYMPANRFKPNRLIKPEGRDMIRPRMWLLVLVLLAGIALLIILKSPRNRPAVPESQPSVGEPASQPPENLTPPPRYPSDSQKLAQAPAPKAVAVEAGFDSASQALLNQLFVKL